MGCSGIREESREREKNTNGSIRINNHAAILVLTLTIFFFNGLNYLKAFPFKAKRDNPDKYN
jgi:hypothetical protein